MLILLPSKNFWYRSDTSSVIRKKGESQNGCFKKTKHVKFSGKRTFLTPWYAHVRVRIRGKKCSFFWKFDVFCFLETPVLRFALLPYYRRYTHVEIQLALQMFTWFESLFWFILRKVFIKRWPILYYRIPRTSSISPWHVTSI